MVRGLPALLPEPKQARRTPGSLRLRERLPIVLREGSGDDEFASALALRDAVRTRLPSMMVNLWCMIAIAELVFL